MKTIAESANDFRDLRTKKSPCVYVDKTAHFHRLITDPGRTLFFIARPRRFGKSLMITTFKYIFQGRRELFEGLDIAKTDYDWQVSPVIHIDPYRTISATEKDFDVSDLSHLNEIGMLYQTGYLTIDSYSSGLYKLRVPDEEVRQLVDAEAVTLR